MSVTRLEAQFRTLLDIRALNDIQADDRAVWEKVLCFWDRPRKLWEVEDVLVYESYLLNTIIRIPPGFVTDLASVPRVPFVYMMVGEIAQEAAVVHDFLYQTHAVNGQPITREQADQVLREAMGACRYPDWQSNTIYAGVRVGGSSSWNSGPRRFTMLGNAKPETPPPTEK